MIYNSVKPTGWTDGDPNLYIPEIEAIDEGFAAVQTYFGLNNFYHRTGSASNLVINDATYMESIGAWVFVGDYSGSEQFGYTFDGLHLNFGTSGAEDWTRVAYGNNHTVANIIGADTANKLKETSTLSSWATRTVDHNAESGSCRGIYYSAPFETFVASFENGRIDTSPDGITWTNAIVDPGWYADNLFAHRFAGSKEIIVGVGEVTNNLFTYSIDGGLNWEVYSAPELTDFKIAYNSALQLFMAVGLTGNTFVSGDGITWQNLGSVYEHTETPRFNSLVSYGTVFVATVDTVSGVRALLYNDVRDPNWKHIQSYYPKDVFVGSGQLIYSNTQDNRLFYGYRCYISDPL